VIFKNGAIRRLKRAGFWKLRCDYKRFRGDVFIYHDENIGGVYVYIWGGKAEVVFQEFGRREVISSYREFLRFLNDFEEYKRGFVKGFRINGYT